MRSGCAIGRSESQSAAESLGAVLCSAQRGSKRSGDVYVHALFVGLTVANIENVLCAC
jgi:hypothetical protein